MSQHTPGPWAVEHVVPASDEPEFWPIAGPHTFKVADVYLSESDARLIAKAPEMLEYLKGCYSDPVARALLREIEGD